MLTSTAATTRELEEDRRHRENSAISLADD